MPPTLNALSSAARPELPDLSWLEGSLRVRHIMSTAPLTVAPDVSVHQAHSLMQARQIRHLPVLDEGRLVGLVSDCDIRLALPSPATSLAGWEVRHLLATLTVGEIMTHFVVTIAPGTPVAGAVRRLLGHKIGALPVVENRHVIGILTRTDVLRAFLRLDRELSDVA
jgi:acetoin utilization protein AcuB